MVNISSLVISIKICINDSYRLNTIFYHCRGPMLNNCTGLKNFDEKQDFVCCFLFEKYSKTEKRVKTENANKTAFIIVITLTILIIRLFAVLQFFFSSSVVDSPSLQVIINKRYVFIILHRFISAK